MRSTKTRIWRGVGAYLLAGASTAVLADHVVAKSEVTGTETASANRVADWRGMSVPLFVADMSAGGKSGAHRAHEIRGSGGEGGEGGSLADLAVETQIMVRLLAMKGHLRAGKDLFEADNLENAKMHFAHPLSEEYEEIAPFSRTLASAPSRGRWNISSMSRYRAKHRRQFRRC